MKVLHWKRDKREFDNTYQLSLMDPVCFNSIASIFVSKKFDKIYSIVYNKTKGMEGKGVTSFAALREYFNTLELALHITSARIRLDFEEEYEIDYTEVLKDYYEFEQKDFG